MKRQYIITICLLCCATLLALVACSENLFGSPGNSNCGRDVKCLRMDAENAFRDGDYAKAYKAYSQIVEIDARVSAGYFGMAKAGLWMKDINPFDVFSYVNTGTDSIAFMNDFPYDQNKFYQGMRFISPALHELEHRDSMTLHYDYYKRYINNDFDTVFVRTMDSLSWMRAVAANDFDMSNISSTKGLGNSTYEIPLPEKLKKFIKTYNCNAGKCSGVPESDREFIYGTYKVGLLITTLAETILKSLDTNGDGCIAKRCPEPADETKCRRYNPSNRLTDVNAWRNWGCEKKEKYSFDLSINLSINESGNFEVDVNQILEDMELDEFFKNQINDPKTPLPGEIQSFNDKMDEFNESIYDLLSVIGGFKDRGSGDVPFGLEGEMGGYRDFSKFYKVGTNIDEDGDGCIGEDIMDGQDNDGDGLINGNARLTSVDPADSYYANDGLMGFHGMTGIKDDDMPIRIKINDPRFRPIANKRDRSVLAELKPDDGYVTVIKFTQTMPNYWTSNSLDDKLRVAQDTTCPPKISLKERIDLIGGCWPNYTEQQFVDYWLKRKLARPEDQITRVHSTCKDDKCTGIGCLRK